MGSELSGFQPLPCVTRRGILEHGEVTQSPKHDFSKLHADGVRSPVTLSRGTLPGPGKGWRAATSGLIAVQPADSLSLLKLQAAEGGLCGYGTLGAYSLRGWRGEEGITERAVRSWQSGC